MNGTWIILMPASATRYSAARCVEVPTPAEANGIWSGLAFAASISAFSDLYGPFAAVTILTSSPLSSTTIWMR